MGQAADVQKAECVKYIFIFLRQGHKYPRLA